MIPAPVWGDSVFGWLVVVLFREYLPAPSTVSHLYFVFVFVFCINGSYDENVRYHATRAQVGRASAQLRAGAGGGGGARGRPTRARAR